MLTLVYRKGAKSEAKELADAFEKKYKGLKTAQAVELVSEEQLKDWNITVSRLHASLGEVLSAAEARGLEAGQTYAWLLQASPALMVEFLKTLHYLKTVSLRYPSLAAVGYHNLPLELSRLLATVCVNVEVIRSDSTFQSEGLMGVIAAISDVLLSQLLQQATSQVESLNG